ncbi:peroxidase 16-like [Phragmites australis]|uniref:peroxidase 16-like n=1 Tax=Phragmites australis TaxID=29695 RepID=UPI002D7A11D1|nr:peroxidase 16-like [Phragmites australis]
MARLRLAFVAAAVVSAAFMSPSAVAQLRPDYYASICPNLETIVRGSVQQSMAKSPISAPAALRLFFHDCVVRGCDASIMIVNSNGDDEWRNSDNQSLKPDGFQTILNAKAAVDSDPQCRYKVSCADILALAAKESVYQSGGPNYQVELGRYDGRVSTRDIVVLPHANFNLDQLNAFFSGLGLSQTDMIALSGGHTLGAADCPFFQYRIGTDTTMDSSLAAQLRGTCSSNPNGFAFLDGSPVSFDNAFYRNLQGGRGLLGSDQVLYSDTRSRGTVDYYASNQGAFFGDFKAAMTKLGRVGVKTAATGEIRRDCRFPN